MEEHHLETTHRLSGLECRMGKLERGGDDGSRVSLAGGQRSPSGAKKKSGGPQKISDVPVIFFDHKSPRGTIVSGTEVTETALSGEKPDEAKEPEREEPTIIVANAVLF